MKIAAVQPLSLSDFPECSAAIIFTIGCNLRCSYCHNKNLWDDQHQLIRSEEVFEFLQSKINQLDGVVITGGEPTIQPDLLSFIKTIKQFGYKVKLNTNGTNPDCIKNLITEDLLDYIAMDIKAPLAKYVAQFGVTVAVHEIQASIDLITSSGVPHEFRTIWDPTWLQASDIEAIRASLPKTSKYISRLLSSGK